MLFSYVEPPPRRFSADRIGLKYTAFSLARLRPRRNKAGLPPGTPIHIGDRTGNAVLLSSFVYNADAFSECRLETVEQACAPPEADHVTWLNVDGVHDVATVGRIRHHP